MSFRLRSLLRVRAALAFSLCVLLTTPTLAVEWDGGTANPGDYNDPLNWTGDELPGQTGVTDAIIGDAGFIGQAQVNLAADPTIATPIGDLRVGNGTFGDGVFNHSAGSLVTDPGKWSFLAADSDGFDSARGEYNLSGSASFTQSNAEFHVGIGGGRRDFGAGQSANEGYLSVADNAMFNGDSVFIGSNDDNFGQVDQTGGTFNANSWISIGRQQGAVGVYNMSGGALNVTVDGITVGESTGASGEFNISNDSVVNSGILQVGRSLASTPEDGGGTGLLTIDGDDVDVTVGFFTMGFNGDLANSTYTQTDGEGTLRVTSASSISPIKVLEDVYLNDGSVAGFAKLEVDFSSNPTGSLLLIDNQGANAVNGTFMDLAEGAVVPDSGGRTISYTFGDGNDIGLIDPTGGDLFGDFEPDGDVDIIDFGLFADAFDTMTGDAAYDPRADEEPDGDVDIIDFGKFADNFGIGTLSTTSVPEPASLALVGLSMIGLLCSRHRS